MTPNQSDTARRCLAAAEDNSMAFPQIVGALAEAGFESYLVDYRRSKAVYYLPDGESLELDTHSGGNPVATLFDTAAIRAAIADAQALVEGYTYLGFSEKVKQAGCAGYLVSFIGRRALYFGRSGETYTEHFPD